MNPRVEIRTAYGVKRVILYCPNGHEVVSAPALSGTGRRLLDGDFSDEQCGYGSCDWGKPIITKAEVILFKPSGKYYTTEPWRIPEGAIGPYDMDRSPDFRRISGGAVLVETQEPWGFPHLFPGVS